jgi:hypothetical protein
MIHSEERVPSIVDNEEDLLVRIIPIKKLVKILDNKDMVFA